MRDVQVASAARHPYLCLVSDHLLPEADPDAALLLPAASQNDPPDPPPPAGFSVSGTSEPADFSYDCTSTPLTLRLQPRLRPR